MNSFDIIIVGGGVAGMQAAISAAENGLTSLIVEREPILGGRIAHKHLLFPTFTPATEIIDSLLDRINRNSEKYITISTDSNVLEIDQNECVVTFVREEREKVSVKGKSIVLASGYNFFDATLKQEYGYGVYKNVVTSPELEEMLKNGAVKCANNKEPKTIAFVHCVGSRDTKVNNEHCSRVCCVTGVKQAMELSQRIKGAKVFNFYMDIRMFGTGYEEMYKVAQEKHQVRFIRGRVSEVSQTIDDKLFIKAEDTLVARPLAITVDMVVLLVGMCGGDSNAVFAEQASLDVRDSGFLKPKDAFLSNTVSPAEGVFYAGCVEAPKSVAESINQAISAVANANYYIKGNE